MAADFTFAISFNMPDQTVTIWHNTVTNRYECLYNSMLFTATTAQELVDDVHHDYELECLAFSM